MIKRLITAFASVLFLGFTTWSCQSETKADLRACPSGAGLFAKIITNKGEMVARLAYQKAPMTVANFVGLAEGTIANDVKADGEPYFDGMTFHRVVDDFVIQGGDPNSLAGGNPNLIGQGGPGYSFVDEFHPDLRHDVAGTLSMANSGPATNGSQFFITHRATPNLDDKHAVFGFLMCGMKTLYAIRKDDTIRSIEIIRLGDEAKAFNASQTFEQLK